MKRSSPECDRDGGVAKKAKVDGSSEDMLDDMNRIIEATVKKTLEEQSTIRIKIMEQWHPMYLWRVVRGEDVCRESKADGEKGYFAGVQVTNAKSSEKIFFFVPHGVAGGKEQFPINERQKRIFSELVTDQVKCLLGKCIQDNSRVSPLPLHEGWL